MNYTGGKNQHSWQLLLLAFCHGQKQPKNLGILAKVYGEDVMGESTAGNGLGSPRTVSLNTGPLAKGLRNSMKTLSEENRHLTKRDLTDKMNCDQK